MEETKRGTKDLNKPKRPVAGYFRFLKVYREENPGLFSTESTKRAAVAWKKLSEEERSDYSAKAAKEIKKYQAKMAKYKKSKQYAEYQEKLIAWKKSEKKRLKELKNP